MRTWLEELELAAEIGPRWVPTAVSDGLTPRWTNIGLSSRCVDAFERRTDGALRGVELKVSRNDGVCGLTLGEKRLLRAGAIRVLAVSPVRGLIGEMDADALLAVPRRADGIPVGEARVAGRGRSLTPRRHGVSRLVLPASKAESRRDVSDQRQKQSLRALGFLRERDWLQALRGKRNT